MLLSRGSISWKGIVSPVGLAFVAMLGTGCTNVHMSINAYRSKELPFPEPGSDHSVGVVVQTVPAEPLLNEEIKRKVADILKTKGYAVAPAEKADYVLVCSASMDSGVSDTDYVPVTSPGSYSYSHIYDSYGRVARVSTYIPGETTYLPYTYTIYTKGLVLTLLRRDLVRASGDDKKKEEPLEEATVWRCVTLSTGGSSDLRWIVNHMMLASLDRFGKDTGRQEEVSMALNGERVKRLVEGSEGDTSG